MKISAVVAVYNEEKNIKKCLKSLSFADEIIIIDSMSTDNTVKAARNFTRKIFNKKFKSFSDIKGYGISKAKGDWVLIVDADEEITPELRKRIFKAVRGGSEGIDGYYIKRRTMFLGRWIKHCGWDRDYQLRLFRKNRGKYDGSIVHEVIKVNGKVSKIEEPINHYSYPDSRAYFIKMNRYTSLQAREKQKSFLIIRMIFAPFFRFFKMYFIRAGYLDGKQGLILSVYSGFSDFIKFSKMLEEKRRVKKDGIVIRMPNWIGDAVMASAFLKGVKRVYRNVYALADNSVKEVFEGNPFIDGVISFNKKNFLDVLKAAFIIRRKKIKTGISLTPSFSSAFILFTAGIKIRAGFSDDGFFLNRKYKRDKKHRKEHIIDEYKKIFYLVSTDFDFKGMKQFVPVDAVELKKAPRSAVVIAPFVKFGPAKMWPYAQFEILAADIAKNTKNVLIAGTGQDRKYKFSAGKKVKDLRGRTSLKRIIAIISRAKLFIGNDSGLMHIADALGTPLVGIFGSTSAKWTGPVSGKSHVIASDAECSPCFDSKCRYGHYDCLKGITVEMVKKKIRARF